MSGYIGTQPVPQATQSRDSFTATGGQTTFATAGYQPGYIDVYLNGVHLVDVTDYTATNGSDVVLASGASINDIVEVVAYSTFEVLNQTLTGTTTVDVLNVTGAFTSLGIDDNATSTAITLSSGGNVGIGTSSPSALINTSGAVGAISSIQTQMLLSETGTNTSTGLQIKANNSTYSWDAGAITFLREGAANSYALVFDTSSGGTNDEAMRIDSSGNVGIGVIPEAWGTTFKMLDIGSGGASVGSSGGSDARILANAYFDTGGSWRYSSSNYASYYRQNGGTHQWGYAASGTSGAAISWSEAMRIDSSGNVGIGTSSPLYKLNVGSGSGSNSINIFSGSTDTSSVYFTDNNTGVGSYIGRLAYNHTADAMLFTTNASERMRIDSSGNVLVGTTDTTPFNNNAGTSADFGFVVNKGGGYTSLASYNTTPLYINRTSSDGDIVNFRKDGTTVGSIGTLGSTTYFSGVNSGLRMDTTIVVPTNASGTNLDASLDLGAAGVRFKNLYLSGGVYLGGTGSANYLDDYEEGTTDPSIVGGFFDMGNGTIGSYTRVGNIVNFQAKLQFPSNSNGNEAQITLPFVVSTRANYYPTGANGPNGTTAASHCLAIGGQSYIVFQPTSGATTSTNANLSGSNINVNITYQTTP